MTHLATTMTLVSVLLTAAALPSAAEAAAAPRVAVAVAGPGGNELRDAVVARMRRHCQIVPVGRAGATLVDGRVSPGPSWRVRLVVRKGQDAKPAGTLSWASSDPGELMTDVLREAPGKLLALVGRTQAARPARAPAPPRHARARSRSAVSAETSPPMSGATEIIDADEASDPAISEDAPDQRADRQTSTGGRTPWLEASVGPSLVSRAFTFTDNPSGAPGYSLPLAAALSGEVLAMPLLVPLSPSWGQSTAHVGVAVAAESSVGAQTAANEPGESGHATRFLSYRAGARARLLWSSAALLVGLDYGEQSFEVDLPPEVTSPGVSYRFWRPSVAGRVVLDDFRLSLSAAYLGVLSLRGWGDAGQFPRASVRGLEGGLRVAYALSDPLEVELGADVRRFAFTMNARPGDPVIVGGALDEYVSLALRLTWRMR